MLKDFLKTRSLSIVIVGDFNPVIIQPFWLATKKLISEKESQSAKVKLIHPQLTQIELGWVTIEVSMEQFELRTSDESAFEMVRDLAVNIFRILKETPIRAFGINHYFHYEVPDATRYYKIGTELANLNIWKGEGLFTDPRMLRLDVIEQKRIDGYKGRHQLTIQPSDQITDQGIMVSYNDHFAQDDPSKTDAKLIEILDKVWDDSSKRAEAIPPVI